MTISLAGMSIGYEDLRVVASALKNNPQLKELKCAPIVDDMISAISFFRSLSVTAVPLKLWSACRAYKPSSNLYD